MKVNKAVLLVGAGAMGVEYARVFKALKVLHLVVGRGKKSAENFYRQTGIKPATGGIKNFLAKNKRLPETAVVAVPGDQLGETARELIKQGVKSILLEKPGGVDQKDITSVKKISEKNTAEVFIAYNRRFYASVVKGAEIIKKDGGVLSFHFEFNEPAKKIAIFKDSPRIKENWILHNSSHVIDLAFFLCGTPKSMDAFRYGKLIWHPSGGIFTGSGVSNAGAPFTFHANWLSPGRWGIEIMTKNHRLIFRPMEKLKIQKHGSFEIFDAEINDKLDIEFKPGLYNEVKSFLGNKLSLCTITEQFENLKWYSKLEG